MINQGRVRSRSRVSVRPDGMGPVTKHVLAFRSPERTRAPELDAAQRSVVDHPGGPLLVLAGPGTGKTTTLVEAIVDRIETRGASPDSVLALTFSRKAAEQLRDRVTSRLGMTMATTLSSTFHSFAYGLVRQHSAADAYVEPLRLLSAPEQDVVLQQLLTPHEESVTWPAALAEAVRTRGFAREVQAVLSRAREKGLEPLELEKIAESEGSPELLAAAKFMEQYLNVLGFESAIDYPELIHQAVLLAEQPAIRSELRGRFRHVFVDEYQDTDPSQVRLLRALAGDGRDLAVVGDPDQSIYGFRGADVRGILDFPRDFPRADGGAAEVVALTNTRRFGPRLLAASQCVASSIGLTGAIPLDTFAAFRSPTSLATDHGPGLVEVRTYDTARAETEHIADLLRRAHLEDGIAWSQMAVLVRSGRGSIPSLRRSLGAAGVPVDVASDETPLVREPAVLPLLDALAVVAHRSIVDPEHPHYFGADRAAAMLASPLVGLDATDVRALARALRSREKERTDQPLSSPELLRRALLDPGMVADLRGRGAKRVVKAGELLRKAGQRLEAGDTAEEVLWVLWSGTDWPRRLRAGVEAGGNAARLAHRDLDAVCALFDTAARAEEQRGHTSVTSFLAALTAQQIPADTLSERGVRGDTVRLLTAHRAKGLEWELTVVARVQETSWPDLRRRSSLLQADRIDTDGLLPPSTVAAMLAEERRLFYVACTRARRRLLVTAVRSPEDDGEQPSRFVDELGIEPVNVSGRPARPLSLAGLVAELRRTVADSASSEPLREAAARRLASLVLAQGDHDGGPIAPQADPATWWGTRAASKSSTPVRRPDEPLMVSASTLEGLLTCPARWFLTREAGGQEVTTAKQGFGSVVHAIADRIASGELDSGADLMPYVDQVWGQMVFRTPWAKGRERLQVKAALDRFVAWHNRPGARVVVGTEEHLTCEVALPGGTVVRLNGYADRLELDEGGRVVVVDLKTGKQAPTGPQVTEHPQLGLYQLAVDHGAADERVGHQVVSGGAELVQLRHGEAEPKVQTQPPQPADPEGLTKVQRQLLLAIDTMQQEDFVARPGTHCRYCSFHAICPTKTSGTVLS